MKKIFLKYKFCVIIAACALFFTSCSDNIDAPALQLSLSNNIDTVNQNVTFTITGSAEYVSIWTGDSTHNYDGYLHELSTADTTTPKKTVHINSGEPIDIANNQYVYSYIYKKAGVYQAVVIGTNTGDNSAKIKQTILKQTVTITGSK
jgi:hypothetical protein